MSLTYLRLEILRVLRNKRTIIFSLLLPGVLLVSLGSVYKGTTEAGVSALSYLMVSMGVFGTLSTATGISGAIAVERGAGWNRQLRLTPMNPVKYVISKVALSLITVLPTIALVYAIGVAMGVRLPAAVWFGCAFGTWLSALPFAALGLVIGYLSKPDSIQPISAAVFFLLALVGGLWIPIENMPTWEQHIAKFTPSYWAVDEAHAALEHGHLSGTGVLVLLIWALALGLIGFRRFQADTARA